MTKLDILQSKVKALDSCSLFGDNHAEKEVEAACVGFLKSLGYKVVARPRKRVIKNIDELINFFYNMLEYHHNDICSLVSNKQKDRTLLTRFITQRQEDLSCSFEDGIQDCANIIEALFVFEDDIGLTIPICMWVFGGEKCKWVTDKVIGMLNDNEEILNDVKLSSMVAADEMNSKDYTGFDFKHLRRKYGN